MSLPEPEDPAAADPHAGTEPAELPVVPQQPRQTEPIVPSKPFVAIEPGEPAEPSAATEASLPTEQPAPPRRRRRRVIALAIAVPLLLAGGTLGTLALLGVFDKPKPPQLTAVQEKRIAAEVDDRSSLLSELDTARSDYKTQLSDWNESLQWTKDVLASSDAPTPAVPNPGGDAMPGDDPYGRAFLDSIGATDVTVMFEAGPDNCGYKGSEGESNYVYAGGCFNSQYVNTLFMAWDPGAEDLVWPIFVHEAMHWYQNEHYLQDTYLADLDGIDSSAYNERWEADASCRAVYVYGIPIEDYEGSTSPCTIDGWYEGFIVDYLASLGTHVTKPDPATFEVAEASRP